MRDGPGTLDHHIHTGLVLCGYGEATGITREEVGHTNVAELENEHDETLES